MAAKKASTTKKAKGPDEDVPGAPVSAPAAEPPPSVPEAPAPAAAAPPAPAKPPLTSKPDPVPRRIARLVKRSDWRPLGVDALGEKLVAAQFGRGLLVASARGTPTYTSPEALFGARVPPAFTSELPANEMPELPKEPKAALPDAWERFGWKSKKTKDGCAFWYQVVGRARVHEPASTGAVELKLFVVCPVHGLGVLEATLSYPEGERHETVKVAGSTTQTTDANGNPVNLPGMDLALSAPASAESLQGLKASVAVHAVCNDVAHSGTLDVTEELSFER